MPGKIAGRCTISGNSTRKQPTVPVKNPVAMPKINQLSIIDITPERFLESCSPTELREIDHLIQSPRFRVRMDQPEADRRPVNYPDVDDVIDPIALSCH